MDNLTTILIVEDEELLNSMLAESLTMRGFKTLSTMDGETALQIVREKREQIHLIIVDYGLGRNKISGGDVILTIRSEFPNIQHILTSGDSDDFREFTKQHSDIPVLLKPFRIAKLRESILKILS